MSLKRSAFKIEIVFCHCHSCVCHVVVVVGTTTRMVALHSLCRSVTPTLPLDVTALPTENPLPLFRFVTTTKNMGRYVVFLCWLQSHPRGFQVFLQLQRQYPDLCYKGPSLLLFWIK